MVLRSEERTQVQSLNDFIVFGAMVAGSFVSGGLLANYGWDTVCRIMFPPLLIAWLALFATRASRAATSNVPA